MTSQQGEVRLKVIDETCSDDGDSLFTERRLVQDVAITP